MKGKTKVKSREQIIDWIKFGILLLAIFIGLTNTISFTRVLGNSMDPTLQDGSWIAINRLSSHFTNPKFGDVVIVRPNNLGYDIIKRVIGMPGDAVAIKDGTVYVNGLPIPEMYTVGKSPDMEEKIIDDNVIFILGDNRTLGESLDSRDPSLGTVPIDAVRGYAIISLFPLQQISKPLKF